jgi:WD40 repeat protein
MVKIWDTGSGKCLQTLEHSDFVNSVAFSHSSARLVSASWDKTVKIWDTGSGKCLQTLEGHSDFVNSVAFSYDSARLASASRDNTVNTGSGKCLQTLVIRKALFDISFDPTGSYPYTDISAIALRASSSSLSLNLPTNIVDLYSPQHYGWALSLDGEWIIYNSENRVWIPSEYRPSCLAVSGKTIGVGTASGKVWMSKFKVDSV